MTIWQPRFSSRYYHVESMLLQIELSAKHHQSTLPDFTLGITAAYVSRYREVMDEAGAKNSTEWGCPYQVCSRYYTLKKSTVTHFILCSTWLVFPSLNYMYFISLAVYVQSSSVCFTVSFHLEPNPLGAIHGLRVQHSSDPDIHSV